MDKETIRLECLKLAVNRSANQQEILAKAAEYVKFIYSTMTEDSLAAKAVPTPVTQKP